MARYERGYAGEKRTAFLGIQLTPSERGELDAGASRTGAPTVSEFARALLFKRMAEVITASTRRNPEALELVNALDAAARENNALGNLLNQLMRHLHSTGGDAQDMAAVWEVLALIRQASELYVGALERVMAL